VSEPIRIANCSGFYGDRLAAAAEMVEGGPIDVLTGDWLAELTMLILARTQAKRPGGGTHAASSTRWSTSWAPASSAASRWSPTPGASTRPAVPRPCARSAPGSAWSPASPT